MITLSHAEAMKIYRQKMCGDNILPLMFSQMFLMKDVVVNSSEHYLDINKDSYAISCFYNG